MKYIVMECHEGYALLMDEESRVLKAANLRYEVGQHITSPVLMNCADEGERKISFYVTRFAAAAACLALAVSAGSFYYSRNFKTHSTVLISAKANIRMDLNKKGEVLSLSGGDSKANELLKEYVLSRKDKISVARDIIELETSKGYYSENDVPDLYIKAEDAEEYNSLKEEFETGFNDTQINVYEYGTPLAKTVAEAPAPPETKPANDAPTPEAPQPPDNTAEPPAPPKPAENGGPAAPAAPGAPAAPVPPGEVSPPAAPSVHGNDPAKPAESGKNTVKPNDRIDPPKPEGPNAPQPPAPKKTSYVSVPNETADANTLLTAPAPPAAAADINIEEPREAIPGQGANSLLPEPEVPKAAAPAPEQENYTLKISAPVTGPETAEEKSEHLQVPETASVRIRVLALQPNNTAPKTGTKAPAPEAAPKVKAPAP